MEESDNEDRMNQEGTEESTDDKYDELIEHRHNRKWWDFLGKELDDWRIVANNLQEKNIKRTFRLWWAKVKENPWKHIGVSIVTWIVMATIIFGAIWVNDNVRICEGYFADNMSRLDMTIKEVKELNSDGRLYIAPTIRKGIPIIQGIDVNLTGVTNWKDIPGIEYDETKTYVAELRCTYDLKVV